MDYLNDDKLEEMGYIKEIDTLAIVEKASKITEKKRNKLPVISFTDNYFSFRSRFIRDFIWRK